jgi:Peptidase family M23
MLRTRKCWRLKLSKLFITGIVLLFIGQNTAIGQYEGVDKDYFTFPIQPDKVNFLSGTMGELRATHFHAGLDIKTNGKQGLKVYAAAGGYISRIRVATGGYGNSIYIKHPNGTSTVYAHLQRFNPVLASYVLKRQYEDESFVADYFPQKNEFKIKQGEVIGLSGNSGSSSGPHLHFEIRNSKQEVLDPLRFGFEQIRDEIAPIPLRVALKTMDIDSRINGQFGRFEFELERQGNAFIIRDTIRASGKIGVEIWAHDKLNGATNRNGIPTVYMFNNNDAVFKQEIDNVSFATQKQILVHTNYQAQKTTNRRYNKLYIDDGNTLKFYDNKDSGFLSIQENSKNQIGIQMIDAYENERKISFNIVGEAINDKINSTISPPDIYSVQDNTLILTREVEDADLENITIYTKENSRVLGPTYSNQNHHIYLWDLRKGLPDSVSIGNHSMDISFNTMVPSTSSHSYDDNTYSLTFSKKSFFDTTYIQTKHYVENEIEILELQNQNQPVKSSFGIELNPLLQYDSLEQHHIFELNSGKNPSFIGGVWNEGKIKFSVSGPGRYTLMKDEKPPSVKELSRTDSRISFRIQDKESGIKEFRAEIDGKWILMNYDSKRNLIWSERLDKKTDLKGNFSLKILDNSGNESILEFEL